MISRAFFEMKTIRAWRRSSVIQKKGRSWKQFCPLTQAQPFSISRMIPSLQQSSTNSIPRFGKSNQRSKEERRMCCTSASTKDIFSLQSPFSPKITRIWQISCLRRTKQETRRSWQAWNRKWQLWAKRSGMWCSAEAKKELKRLALSWVTSFNSVLEIKRMDSFWRFLKLYIPKTPKKFMSLFLHGREKNGQSFTCVKTRRHSFKSWTC